MEYGVRVFMDKRDVTPWVREVQWKQADSITRKFQIVFNGWHAFSEANRWDIFESADPTGSPRAEVVIRNGIVPNDAQRTIRVGDAVPSISADGYEYVYLTMRRAPSETVILVPSRRNYSSDVEQAKKNAGGFIGSYRVWPGCSSLHTGVRRLAAAARVRVRLSIPNYDLAPKAIDPKLSYWKAIEELTDPYAPVRYYVRSTNTLVIADPMLPIMGAGSTLTIPSTLIKSMEVRPQRLRRVRRLLMRVPTWR